MLKEREIVVRKFLFGVDLLVVVAAYFVAHFFRGLISESDNTLWHSAYALLLAAPLWSITLYANGMSQSIRTRTFLEILWTVIKSGSLTFLICGASIFLFKFTDMSRLFFLLFSGISLLFILVEKSAVFWGAHFLRRLGVNTRRLLIVGTGKRALDFIRKVNARPEWGFELLGAIDDEPSRGVTRVNGLEIIGNLSDIPRIFHQESVDEVIFLVPRSRLSALQGAIEDCETEGVVVTIAVDLFDMRLAKASVTELEGLPLLHFKTTHASEWQLFVKRLFDLAVSGFGILALSPFLLLIAILIKATSPGPVFFKQPRLGLHGRKFTLIKFRTMQRGAHDVLSIVSDLNQMTTPEFRMKKTAWITPLGRFLRKFSLDELPQLFNVFAGHMSIVGPRPTVQDEVEKYKAWQRRRFSMKPGITCLWQVKGRNNIAFDGWMKLDLEYLDNWSLRLDFIILMRTIPVVLFGRGAY
jgi:exopolysaccharide biosynthesis polyprenyl glycosylphosphotransferase